MILGARAGCNWGGHENFLKENWGYETFGKEFYCCGMTSCTHFSIGYGHFQQK